MPIVRLPSGKNYELTDGETFLDGALRCGIALPYSCRTGRCSTCKTQTSGGLTVALAEEVGLTATERSAGWILSCVRTAQTDVQLETEDLGDVILSQPVIVPCRIFSLQLLSRDVLRVILRLPPSAKFTFHPGQYIDVIGPKGQRRSYSIANSPSGEKLIELHIGRVANGEMTIFWFEQAKVGDLLRLNGPLGTFFLRDVNSVDLVFLSTGTGIAPVKSILEALEQGLIPVRPRSISVFWGGRILDDLYWDVSSFKSARFFPVLSRADSSWPGIRGYVQAALLTQQPDWARTRVYACGSEGMIHDAQKLLLEAGLNPNHFVSDAFVASAKA